VLSTVLGTVEALDLTVHPLQRRGGHPLRVVDDVADRLAGDLGGARDIDDRRASAASPC